MTQRCPAAQKSIAHRAHKCIARADDDLIHLAGRVDVARQRLQQLVHVQLVHVHSFQAFIEKKQKEFKKEMLPPRTVLRLLF